MDKPVAAAPTGAKEKVEKQARQLAYDVRYKTCLLYTSPSPRDVHLSRMPSSA